MNDQQPQLKSPKKIIIVMWSMFLSFLLKLWYLLILFIIIILFPILIFLPRKKMLNLNLFDIADNAALKLLKIRGQHSG